MWILWILLIWIRNFILSNTNYYSQVLPMRLKLKTERKKIQLEKQRMLLKHYLKSAAEILKCSPNVNLKFQLNLQIFGTCLRLSLSWHVSKYRLSSTPGTRLKSKNRLLFRYNKNMSL